MNSRRCWVSNCRNSNSEILEKTNTQLFRFPLNKEKCQEWVSAIGDPDLSSHTWEALNKCGYVCKDHFEEKHTTAVSEITENAVPTVFRNFRSPSDPELMLLETDSDKKSVLGCGYNETSSSSVEPVINQNPMMDDIVMEAESIIKLEEVKVEPTDYGEETTSIFVNEVPLLIPKEEVAEVKQEEENETPLLIPKEEVAEINQEEENEMPLLVEPMEEVEEIKQEEEKELEPLAAVFITSSDVNEYETQTGGCVPKRAINRTRRTNVSLPVVSSAEVAEIIRNYVENYRRDRRLEDTSDDSSSQEARSLPKSGKTRAKSVRKASRSKTLHQPTGNLKGLSKSSDNDKNEERDLAKQPKLQHGICNGCASVSKPRLSPLGSLGVPSTSSVKVEKKEGDSAKKPNSPRFPKTHFPESLKEQVVDLALSRDCSVAAAARHFGVSARSAQKWLQRWQQTGDVKRQKGSGTWRVSSSEQDALLLATVRANPFLHSTQLKRMLAFPGCYETVRKRMREAGVEKFADEWCLKLCDEQRVDRMAFALDNAHRDWEDVVFSGACVFAAGEDGPVRVLRPQVTQHNAGYVPEPRELHGRASVACWGWVSARGLGVVQRIEAAPLAAQYLHLLQNVMLPSVRVLYPEGPFYFQQDQQRVHKTDFVQEWLARQREFELLDWPPCSPDLNPVADVWAEAKQVMAAKWPRPRPETCDALWELVADAWDEVAGREDYAAQLVRSLPTRMRQVVELEGYWVCV